MINYQDFNYNGSRITFSKGKNVYVCATQMAKPFGKRPNDWLGLQSTKDFLAAVSVTKNIGITELVITKRGNSSECKQGTWIHEDVALEFARWLSPIFSIWCNDCIKELLAKGHVEMPHADKPICSPTAPTEAVTKNDSYLTSAQRAADKDYSLQEVGRLILWNGKPMRRRLLVAYLHEHGFLTSNSVCADYPTELSLSLGLMCVIDKCKRSTGQKLIKPKVRVTMDGANYFINLLSNSLRGVLTTNTQKQITI